MSFPYYDLYATAISTRNALILALTGLVLIGFELLAIVRQFRPTWLPAATWLIGVGGFYASLALLALLYLAGPQSR